MSRTRNATRFSIGLIQIGLYDPLDDSEPVYLVGKPKYPTPQVLGAFKLMMSIFHNKPETHLVMGIMPVRSVVKGGAA